MEERGTTVERRDRATLKGRRRNRLGYSTVYAGGVDNRKGDIRQTPSTVCAGGTVSRETRGQDIKLANMRQSIGSDISGWTEFKRGCWLAAGATAFFVVVIPLALLVLSVVGGYRWERFLQDSSADLASSLGTMIRIDLLYEPRACRLILGRISHYLRRARNENQEGCKFNPRSHRDLSILLLRLTTDFWIKKAEFVRTYAAILSAFT